jgi:hypothetical protein
MLIYGHNWEKMHQNKLFVKSIEEDKLKFCTLFVSRPFLLAKFMHFLLTISKTALFRYPCTATSQTLTNISNSRVDGSRTANP